MLPRAIWKLRSSTATNSPKHLLRLRTSIAAGADAAGVAPFAWVAFMAVIVATVRRLVVAVGEALAPPPDGDFDGRVYAGGGMRPCNLGATTSGRTSAIVET
jgi:hypothetical protein